MKKINADIFLEWEQKECDSGRERVIEMELHQIKNPIYGPLKKIGVIDIPSPGYLEEVFCGKNNILVTNRMQGFTHIFQKKRFLRKFKLI